MHLREERREGGKQGERGRREEGGRTGGRKKLIKKKINVSETGFDSVVWPRLAWNT